MKKHELLEFLENELAQRRFQYAVGSEEARYFAELESERQKKSKDDVKRIGTEAYDIVHKALIFRYRALDEVYKVIKGKLKDEHTTPEQRLEELQASQKSVHNACARMIAIGKMNIHEARRKSYPWECLVEMFTPIVPEQPVTEGAQNTLFQAA